jgi:hypothetical protein
MSVITPEEPLPCLKALLSLIFNEGLILVCYIGFGFFLEFFLNYWFALTIFSMIVDDYIA